MKWTAKTLALGIGIVLATPDIAAAQTAPKTAADATAAPDAARLAAARSVADRLWPLGTGERLMKVAFGEMMDSIFASMYDMPLSSFAGAAGATGKDAAALGSRTMRDAMLAADPHFEERMRITMRVMGEEMAPVMAELEPGIRDGMAAAYARRFTVAQLAEMRAFFDTPTGQAYAADATLLMMSPEVMGSMQAMMPKLVERMPAIMTRLQEATKHLPPPPKSEHKE